MANTTVGTAYLDIVPRLSKGAIPSTLPGAAATGKSTGSTMGGAMASEVGAKSVAIGNILADVAMKAASAFGQLFKDTLNSYANYEQLVGGVDTLFKDASATVQANAAAAFQTAGISANEYMETVTSFSGALLRSVAGDTARAAQLSDTAIQDMADQANKYGTSMQMVQDTYTSLARGNYQTLDNLFGGMFAGTKKGLEDMLTYAEQYRASMGETVDYTSDNYADIVSAIHDVSEAMGVAGTTALEGATTIQGSVNTMKAAWSNFTTGLMDDNADIGQLFTNLVESVVVAGSNVLPRISEMIVTIFTELPGAIFDALRTLPAQIGPMLDSVFGAGAGDMFSGFITDITTSFSKFGESMQPVFELIKGAVADLAPIFMEVGGHIMNIVGNIIDILATVLPPVLEVVVPIAEALLGKLAVGYEMMYGVLSAITGFLADNVAPVVASVIETIAPYIQMIVDKVVENWPLIQSTITTVMGIIQGVLSTVWGAIVGIVTTAIGIIKGIIGTITSVVSVVSSVFNAVKNAIVNPIETAKNLIKSIIDKIKSIFSSLKLELPHPKLPHLNVFGGEAPWGIGGLGKKPEFSIDWYAQGGFVNGATLIGAGERGTELVWPSYSPYIERYATALASAMGSVASTNVYINGATVNDDVAIETAFYDFMSLLHARYKLGGN